MVKHYINKFIVQILIYDIVNQVSFRLKLLFYLKEMLDFVILHIINYDICTNVIFDNFFYN